VGLEAALIRSPSGTSEALTPELRNIPPTVPTGPPVFFGLDNYEHMLIITRKERNHAETEMPARHIGAMPGKTFFPAGRASAVSIRGGALDLDEYEAIRLADLDGLYQEQAASRMNVSRQTFGGIVEAAHGSSPMSSSTEGPQDRGRPGLPGRRGAYTVSPLPRGAELYLRGAQ